MVKATAARLARAEQESHQRALDELARRRGVLRWVVFARDAQPDPNAPGYWRSDTLELLAGLPVALMPRGLEAIGDEEWIVEPLFHDE